PREHSQGADALGPASSRRDGTHAEAGAHRMGRVPWAGAGLQTLRKTAPRADNSGSSAIVLVESTRLWFPYAQQELPRSETSVRHCQTYYATFQETKGTDLDKVEKMESGSRFREGRRQSAAIKPDFQRFQLRRNRVVK